MFNLSLTYLPQDDVMFSSQISYQYHNVTYYDYIQQWTRSVIRPADPNSTTLV